MKNLFFFFLFFIWFGVFYFLFGLGFCERFYLVWGFLFFVWFSVRGFSGHPLVER